MARLVKGAKIAIIIPCLNEGPSIGHVIADCQNVLPDAVIYVYDNNSTDATSAVASAAGAIVRFEAKRGKGNVIRRAFADIEAEIYILIDGDGSHEATALPRLVSRLVADHLDMVVGARCTSDNIAYRPGHLVGNLLLSGLVKLLFNSSEFSDLLSGYRVLSRRFVKSFPVTSSGFEIETELTIHALDLGIPFSEEPTLVNERSAGTTSKLKTLADGWRILGTIIFLYTEARPLLLFAIVFGFFLSLTLAVALPGAQAASAWGAVASLTLVGAMLACSSLTCGILLVSVSRGRRELKRMIYLTQPAAATQGWQPSHWT